MITAADLFCGAGGTSTGLAQACAALGIPLRLTAINHWDVAVATHTANHPESRHLCASLDALNPRDLYGEGELDLLWASPECTHHSVARGGRPINDQSRATAWCVVRWAEALRPGVIMVENVPEFLTWGAIDSKGKPMKSKKGHVFAAWCEALRALGYRVDWQILCAADYGDPTTRKRLFVQAVRGRRRISWPEPTHAKNPGDLLGTLKPWRGAKEIIDWDLPSTSIYERKKPLSSKTLARIYAGLERYGMKPFVASWDNQSRGKGYSAPDDPLTTITTKARHGIVEPMLIPQQSCGVLRPVSDPVPTVATAGAIGLVEPFLVELRGTDTNQVDKSAKPLSAPLSVVTCSGAHHGLVEPFLIPYRSENGTQKPRSHRIDEPMPTITAGGVGHALVEPYLVSYYGNGEALSVDEPMDTVTTKDRFGLVQPTVMKDGKQYRIDIRFRMLQPHELAAAQGFPEGYQFTGGKTKAVKQIGNAVPVGLARALCQAVLS